MSAVILLTASLLCYADGDIPEGFSSWEEYYNFLVFGEQTEDVDADLQNMKLIAQNEKFNMYYHDSGVDIYLENRKTGKVWGTAVYSDYFDVSSLSLNTYSTLLNVCYADKDKNIFNSELVGNNSEDFSISYENADNGICINVSMPEIQISFDVIFILETDGMTLTIPDDSVEEKSDNSLISVSLLPFFGAAKSGEDGYIFYPDGSGALMNISAYKKPNPLFYSYAVYSEDEPDFNLYDTAYQQDIKQIMLPVFGIKHTSGGIFSNMESGAENAILHLSSDQFYQSYFEAVFRTSGTEEYAFTSKGKEISIVGQRRIKGDRTVRYYILGDTQNKYSDMAVLYRKSLIESGALKKNEVSEQIPISIEMFMGISKNGILGDSIQALTTFGDVQNIYNDLSKNGVKTVDILLKGWSEGGYTTLPTASKAEKKLGGNSELNKLNKAVDKNSNLYLLNDWIEADSDTGSFNAKKYALRDGFDVIFTDNEDGSRHWLNPSLYMMNTFKKFSSVHKNTSVCFSKIGSWLMSDIGATNYTDRREMATAFGNVLKEAEKQSGTVAVTGGNGYALPYADRFYDVPSNDSQYYQNDLSVPFYQMVVHGFKDYSSIAANRSFDYRYQILKSVETGSIPHFVITEQSPNMLYGTDYYEIFSSEYSIWKQRLIDTYNEINEKLSSVWFLTMDNHEYISDDFVRVTYQDGSAVYINYSDKSQQYKNITVNAMDYVLVKGE